MIALLVVTDGRRDYLERTIESARLMLPWADFDIRLVVTDDPHVERLGATYSDCDVLGTGEDHAGFAGTIAAGWCALQGADWVVHLEDDFVFNRPVPVDDMCSVLEADPMLSQMALLRQPWNSEEKAAGGIIPLHPDDFTPCRSDVGEWFEHRRFFTTNPSIYPGHLLDRGWPTCPHSEGVFTHQLLADGYRFGMWGTGEEWVEHIGVERVGVGY